MRLPEVKAKLDALIVELQALSAEIPRRSPVRRAKPKSAKVTPAIRTHIKSTAKYHPDWSYVQIARHYNVNPGRVSEILRGVRV